MPSGSWFSSLSTAIRQPPVLLVLALAAGAGYFAGMRSSSGLPRFGSEEQHLGVNELIGTLRAELSDLKLDRIRNREDALFQLDTLDLEIAFVVKASDKKKGEFSYEVVTLGTETEQAREKTHRLTLHLITIPPQRVVSPTTDLSLTPGDRVIELPPVKAKE